jgi:hypothetical protein
MLGDYNQYLYSATNAMVADEYWGPGWDVKYWCPSYCNTWASIVYKYDLPFNITQAYVSGKLDIFPQHEVGGFCDANLEVSPDGVSWTRIEEGHNPAFQLRDVSSVLQGSTTAFVRVNLIAASLIDAQFARTDSLNYRAPIIYEFQAVPEPASIGLFLLSGWVISRYRRK